MQKYMKYLEIFKLWDSVNFCNCHTPLKLKCQSSVNKESRRFRQVINRRRYKNPALQKVT